MEVNVAGGLTLTNICLLGGLRLEQEDRVVTHFKTRQTAALLAYLACHPERAHPREKLIDLLWPDSDLDAGRDSLSQALGTLRRLLEPRGRMSKALTRPMPCVLLADRSSVRLNPAAVTTDVAEFEAALRSARNALTDSARRGWLERALEQYQGELMPGVYHEWITLERERLAQVHLTALAELAALQEQAGDLEGALECALQVVKADPLQEEAHRDAIRLYLAMGRPTMARSRYQELKRILEEELGSVPSVETRMLLEPAGRAGGPARAADETKEQTPAAVPPPRWNNLPRRLTRFVGRERELAEVTRLLCRTTEGQWDGETEGRRDPTDSLRPSLPPTLHRLVTLTGAGGCGKSRLGIEVASQVLSLYDDGACLVELAPLMEPGLLPYRLASGLGLHLQPATEILEALTAALKGRHLLLVLDNCEHLLDACARVCERLVETCPGLSILATSREPLRVPGERICRVPSLSLPDNRSAAMMRAETLQSETLQSETLQSETLQSETLHATSLREYEAVQLFVDRAALSAGGFELTDENARQVALICRQMDGIPLAIELAAAWTRVLSVEQIVERLGDVFALPLSGSRTALPRHQTLRACIEWSYSLLSDAEQALLRRLSVFAGGWTLEAAERISDFGLRISDFGPANPHFLNLLTSLVDKSLVLYEDAAAGNLQWNPLCYSQGSDGRVLSGCGASLPAANPSANPKSQIPNLKSVRRYRLLETVRQYARDRLVESLESDEARGRHLDYFLALSEPSEAGIRGPDATDWTRRLEAEHDNLRAALAWSQSSDPVRELRLAGALWWFWRMHTHLSEGRGWLENALARTTAAPAVAPERARALHGAGVIAYFQLDYPGARSFLEAAIELWRELDDRRGLAYSLSYLGGAVRHLGDTDAAHAMRSQSLAILEEMGDGWGCALASVHIANVETGQRRYDRARERYAHSLRLFRQSGDPWGIALSLQFLGGMRHLQGDAAAARPLIEESVAIFRKLGDAWNVDGALGCLLAISLADGDNRRAEPLLEEMVQTRQDLGDRRGMAWAHLLLSYVQTRSGASDGARRDRAEGERLYGELGAGALAVGIRSLAQLAWECGDKDRAQALFQESLRLRREAGHTFDTEGGIEGCAGFADTTDPQERVVRILTAVRAGGRMWVQSAEHGRS